MGRRLGIGVGGLAASQGRNSFEVFRTKLVDPHPEVVEVLFLANTGSEGMEDREDRGESDPPEQDPQHDRKMDHAVEIGRSTGGLDTGRMMT